MFELSLRLMDCASNLETAVQDKIFWELYTIFLQIPSNNFFKAWISFSQGEFLLADCEGLAFAAGGRDKGASKLQRPAPFSLHPIPRHALWLVVLVL